MAEESALIPTCYRPIWSVAAGGKGERIERKCRERTGIGERENQESSSSMPLHSQ